jgi:hypothetical protein
VREEGTTVKKKLLVTAMVAGLAFAGATTPVTAAKRAKELKLFLRWDDDGAGGCGPTYLSPKDAPDAGNSCAFVFQPAQEVLIVSGQGALTHDWPGLLKKPTTFTAGKIKGEFEVTAIAAAQSSLEVVLSALTRRGAVEIGTFTSDTFNTTIVGSVPITFEMKVPKKLVNQKVESVTLSTTFRGVSAQSYIELDDPPAFITFPTR